MCSTIVPTVQMRKQGPESLRDSNLVRLRDHTLNPVHTVSRCSLEGCFMAEVFLVGERLKTCLIIYRVDRGHSRIQRAESLSVLLTHCFCFCFPAPRPRRLQWSNYAFNQFGWMTKCHHIIIGAYRRNESPRFLFMPILFPLVIKTEVISSFYKYVSQSNRKEQKGQRKIAKGVLLPKYTDLSFSLSKILEGIKLDQLLSQFTFSSPFYPPLPPAMPFWTK